MEWGVARGGELVGGCRLSARTARVALRRGLSETAERLDLDVAFMRCETNQHHGDRGPVPQRHAVVDQLRSNASRTDNVDFPASVQTTVPRLRCTCGLRCL